MDGPLRHKLLAMQEGEITEHQVYKALARRERDPANRRTLERIADDERRHSEFWAKHTNEKCSPRTATV